MQTIVVLVLHLKHLKSNMDRFIDISVTVFMCLNVDLKSNMDRFIAIAIVASIAVVIFKIQYG